MPSRKTDSSSDPVPDQESDFDGAWKEGFLRRLQVFLAVFFPLVGSLIDWSVPPVWLNKEISQVIGRKKRRSRSVDLLVKVRLLNGTDCWLLLHIEIQTKSAEDFTERLVYYNAGLLSAFREPVVTLSVLADLNADWLPTEHRFEFGGFERRFQFPVCKLLSKLESEWQSNTTLPVQMARAQIAALRTASDPQGRFNAKWQLVRNLYSAGYTADELREAFFLLDWMLRLRADFEQEFKSRLHKFEEEIEMPYVTSIERLAREEGHDLGQVSLLMKVLQGRIGRLAKPLETRVRKLSTAHREQLAEALFTLASAADLRAWLDNISE